MDFIERWLHVSPDGGNGTFELALILVIVMLGAAALRRRSRRSKR
jgi:MYXO-CTERM domain-containing protein